MLRCPVVPIQYIDDDGLESRLDSDGPLLRRSVFRITVHRARLAQPQQTRQHVCVGRSQSPRDGEWVGIRLTLGTFFQQHPARGLIDRQDERAPDLDGRFWLDGFDWEYPTFDNAETFVQRLVRRGVIARDHAVAAALHGENGELSRRTTQRHFVHATGITHTSHQQIERARHATTLLRQGVSILDAVHDAGYFDQPHLTRSLTRFIGQTPARIARGDEQLSFLYKTASPQFPMMQVRASHHDDFALYKDDSDRPRP
jgi:AraC-like DNA-binding protein